ncbi:MAG TPA: hypothetical protein PKW35_16545 [Nannocystaceae bacterium]|nr:hypothetical protein [Nannocystaceae bacterium]
MKLGVVSALAVTVIWSLVALAQLWFAPLSAEFFVRFSVSAALIVALIVIVILVVREHLSEKHLKDQGFIDG